jgi:hypothetical protein
MSSNAAPKSGFICLKPLYDFIRKHKREYLQALNPQVRPRRRVHDRFGGSVSH